MALRLGKLCGNGPEFWLRLQMQHDLWPWSAPSPPTSPASRPTAPRETDGVSSLAAAALGS
jgi:plasmid maintenance system antidote protein VapI